MSRFRGNNFMVQKTENKTSFFSQLLKNEPDGVSYLRDGDLVEAALLSKTAKAVYFDLGRFGTGIVYSSEISNAKDILKNLKAGDKVSVKVVSIDNEDGFVELSLAGAHKQKEWQFLRELMEKGEILEVKLNGANSGGLVAEINGIKAFLPVSQLSVKNYPRVEGSDKNEIIKELKKLVGQELKVKIIDLNSRNNKLIISEREAAEEDIKKLLTNYKVGDLVDVIVSGVTNFGVFARFADNPSIEGLIHISELDWKIIDHPKEIAKVEDSLKAKIIEIKDSQVFLSLKALKADPWEKAEEKIKEGKEITGVVYKFNPIGVLINLEGDLQGLVHVSEFGGTEEMKKQLELGKSYQFIISSVKIQEKRINLKLKK
ncbi:MAG: RNA binding S1 domain protein [Candidatus Wolfebacteria bacterium GW2011_GWC1_37_10]|uniref:RNA binding S1 domain protein n=2 Tax=Candidatus Wolfeibacteriota TaxID=1752735 RepID=A0A0G0J0V4_9BACT|nr:MAG: RNA binding S1 domain protein [Candidatus Wolfebacteria bacterium GW2011_GWC1_37_10]